MNSLVRWQRAVSDLHAAGESFVLVTIVEARGSSPRDDDGKMVVTADALFDSIGGGQLEYRVTALARDLLAAGRATKVIEDFPLGPRVNQCCGGRVKVLLECLPASRLHLELHGAGHVGRALVRILGEIDCRIRWIDERENALPCELPANVTAVPTRAAGSAVADAPAGAWHLVMTHDHALDLEICDAVLSRGDFAYLGLIGSRSKAVRFDKRLAERGFDRDERARLHCPVGLAGTGGKAPMEIAVSIAADLLQRQARALDARRTATLELVGG